jgi:putative nucleotidyltransferase with HDIG domain
VIRCAVLATPSGSMKFAPSGRLFFRPYNRAVIPAVQPTLPELPRGPIRLAEVLAAFSLATDLGMAQSMGHVIRACYIGMHTARELGLAPEEQAELYYAILLMHSGCTAGSSLLAKLLRADELAAGRELGRLDPTNPLEIINWLAHNVAPDAPIPSRVMHMVEVVLGAGQAKREGERTACEVGVRVAQRLGLAHGVEATLLQLSEQWNGSGPNGLKGDRIRLCARLLNLSSWFETFLDARGRSGAEDMILRLKGKMFDPRAVEAFKAAAKDSRFWEALASENLREMVLDMEPDTPYRHIGEARFDDVVLAFADFADIKSASTLGHSQETARLAEALAQHMGRPPSDVILIRRAALLHDLGHAAVGNNILDKQGPLTPAEQEKMRLHPYYTERILSTVAALRPLAAIAGAHHEWLNGQGYYRGLSGEALPLGARILAVADAFQDLAATNPGHPCLEPQAALKAMQPEVGTHFSPDCFAALAEVLKVAAPAPKARRERPAGLSEREIEVLRLVARGLTNRQIAQSLYLSEKTIGHHLEHIFNKIGVSTRGAAVYFALEHGLIV